MRLFSSNIVLLLSGLIMSVTFSCKTETDPSIRIYDQNPFYWQYRGEPVLLLGGSKEDNLFNHPEGLAEHLDVLKNAGGNYIRNTMSSRNPGNRWPFRQLESGLYDLDRWDDQYWERFTNLLELSYERDIIVQLEIWDPWDYFMSEAPLGYGPENIGWESCPYNPVLNINYTTEESGLDTILDYYSGRHPSTHLFFHTVPELKDIPVVRKYQEAFLEKLLSISLDYPNVLYCMNNEIGENPEWGQYWARFIRGIAEKKGEEVYLADMRRNSDFSSEEQTNLLHDRTHYDFFEISQNNANSGQRHYDLIMVIRDQIVDSPRPLNNVKIYGGKVGWTNSAVEGTRRFWRNIFGGLASSRFHREGPSSMYFGIGLSELAQTHLTSMRMFTSEMNIFTCSPSNELLSEREPDRAYCISEAGRQYAIYFPDGGNVVIDLSGSAPEMELRWLDILSSEWHESTRVEGNSKVTITAPGQGHWAALIRQP